MTEQYLSDSTQSLLASLHTRAQIDYSKTYLLLFSCFNIWYRYVTGSQIDADALQQFKYRDFIWNEYRKGDALSMLRSSMHRIYVLTHHRPLNTSKGEWPGYLSDPDDWRGLVDYWYAVRCDIVHGNPQITTSHFQVMIKLAYESLNVYLTEIMRRLHLAVDEGELMNELYKDQNAKVQKRYLLSPQKHEVDMVPIARFTYIEAMLQEKAVISLDNTLRIEIKTV